MAKVELTPVKLMELKQKAESAEPIGPSPWRFFKTTEEYRTFCEVRDNGDYQVVHDMSVEEGEHIAAADPATVLAMVEEIEILKTALNLLLWEYYSTDLEQEDIDKLFKKQIEMAKKYRESEAGQ